MFSRKIVLFAVVGALLTLIGAPVSAPAAPPWWPVVSGTVYGTDGLTIPGATIQVSELFKGAFRPLQTITADSNGQWTFSNKDNTYRFDFSAPSTDPQSHTLVMARNGVYTLNVTLQSYGSIAGTVTDTASAVGLSGATIEIFKRNADGTWPATPLVTTSAAANGSYTSGLLATGQYA